MTKKELIDYVENQRSLGVIPYHTYSTLIDGIDELEQEPLKEIPKDYMYDTETKGFLVYRHKYTGHEIHIEKPVPRYRLEQEPKIGHWITHPKGIYAHLICDKCLSHAPYDCKTNYCPNCGAKMESEDWVNLADDLIPIMDEVESEE